MSNLQMNQIKFSTSSSLMITSYALISITNFLLVSQHIFSTGSRVKDSTEIHIPIHYEYQNR